MFAAREEKDSFRPCLVVAHTGPVYAALTCRAFRRLGWDVYTAQTGPEARRLARMLDAELVVLDTALPGESGWLTCDKLTREFPAVKVLLIDGRPTPEGDQFAAFVGAAALVPRQDGPAALLPHVHGTGLPVAG